MRRLAITAALLSSLAGCAAQAELYDDKDWTREHGEEGGKWREVESLFSAAESDADKGSYTLRGVRHDLTMSGTANLDARCTCMDVVVGDVNDPKFRWAGEAPVIGPDQQLVAVRTEGSNCPASVSERRRPSIRAVDNLDGHVVLVIEELSYDRPQALGAVITKPKPGRSLWLRTKDVPKKRKHKKKKLKKGEVEAPPPPPPPPYGIEGPSGKACHIYQRPIQSGRPRSGN